MFLNNWSDLTPIKFNMLHRKLSNYFRDTIWQSKIDKDTDTQADRQNNFSWSHRLNWIHVSFIPHISFSPHGVKPTYIGFTPSISVSPHGVKPTHIGFTPYISISPHGVKPIYVSFTPPISFSPHLYRFHPTRYTFSNCLKSAYCVRVDQFPFTM